MYARCMIGDAMIRWMLGSLMKWYAWLDVWWAFSVSMTDVWLGMFDSMLIARCMLACMWVRYKY